MCVSTSVNLIGPYYLLIAVLAGLESIACLSRKHEPVKSPSLKIRMSGESLKAAVSRLKLLQ